MVDRLDAFDLRLVALLQSDATRPVAEIAGEVGLSAPACYRRIRRLRECGVIEREVAIVRPKSLGWTLSMIVLVMLEREDGRTLEGVMQTLKGELAVIEAWSVTGDFDIAMRVLARDMDQFDAHMQRLLAEDERIRSFKTLVVIRELKERSPIPSAF